MIPERSSAASAPVPPYDGSEPPIRCVHFATSLDPAHGGVSRIAPALARAQRDALEWSAVAVDDPERVFAPGLPSPDHVHLHGLWDPPLWGLAREALRRDIPYAVTLHGMLDRWSRRRRWWKKVAAWNLYQRGVLLRAAFIVANSEEERDEAREWIGRRPAIEVIPNGVDPPPAIAPRAVAALRARFGIANGAPLLLYFGRLHPKKGALLLPEILERAAAALPNVRLLVAGPASADAPNIGAALREELARRGQANRAVIAGMLDGDDRWAALAAADLFLLPSAEEGMPMAALEALASGTPVLLTPECRLGDVEPAGAGRLARRSPSAFAEAALGILKAEEPARLARREEAKRFVREHHAWSLAAERHADAWTRVGDTR